MFRRLWYCMVLLLLPICHGFINPSNVATVVHKARKTTSYLDVGSAVLQETEDEARYWLHRAQECAYSTGRFCSLEETQQCLDEIVDIESACVMGTMTSNDVCDIETFLPDVVSQLQDKLTTATGMTTATTDAAQRDATRESHRYVYLSVMRFF